MDSYVRFLEEHLGEIQCGWSRDVNGEKLPFQVVKYDRGPFPGTVTYSTLGLSLIPLRSDASNKLIRQEFFLVTYSNFGDKNIPGILQQVGLQAFSENRPFLRGELIGPYGQLFPSSNLEALYVTIPVYFPESFQTYDTRETTIVQSWLVPVTLNEANYIERCGWDAFESVLEEVDPDLVEFNRKSFL